MIFQGGGGVKAPPPLDPQLTQRITGHRNINGKYENKEDKQAKYESEKFGNENIHYSAPTWIKIVSIRDFL